MDSIVDRYRAYAAATTPQPVAPVPASAAPVGKTKRPPPFSIRLSEADRARLAVEAAGAPLGAYIKEKLLSGAPVRKRRAQTSIEDLKALAQLVILLGESRAFQSLSTLTELAQAGALPLSPETEAELTSALADIRAMRRMLIQALGFKEDRL